MDLFILLVVIGVIIIVLVAYDRMFTQNIAISIFHKDASQNKKCKTDVMSTKKECKRKRCNKKYHKNGKQNK